MYKITRIVSLLSFIVFTTSSFSYQSVPRLYLWGLAGSREVGRADLLTPFLDNGYSLFYGDFQSKVGNDRTWFGSAGLGYRTLQRSAICGGYLFLDRSESDEAHHYWSLSPGLELINDYWDVRVNGYIPINKQSTPEKSFFPSGVNNCGQHGDCSSVTFIGHQQFEHRFLLFEEVGRGADGEVGVTIPRMQLSLHGGGYYYNLRDLRDIRGVEGRAELPLKSNLALTCEACYDNYQHGAIVGGIRIQLGHAKSPECFTLHDHFYDRVARNLGTVKSGAGTPIVKGIKDEGLFLERDNIYFFTATDGVVFTGANSGTFENPLRADQFNQQTVNAIKAITGNGNFYFNSGSYNLGATTVTLYEGQSLFGRSDNYRCTAIGDERPLLAFSESGTAPLIETGGNNIIDSMRIENSITGPATAIGLAIENDPNVFICNSEIAATTTVFGNNAGINSAIGILASSSIVVIDPSVINAVAAVTGTNNNNNIAAGIGNNLGNFSGNSFTLHDSTVTATAEVGGNDPVRNMAVGIGAIGNATNTQIGIFLANNFTIVNSLVKGTSQVAGNISASSGDNLAQGIGTIFGYFPSNTFTIRDSRIEANARLEGSNLASNNVAEGIGREFGVPGVFTGFTNNHFTISNTSILAALTVGGVQSGGFSFVTGLGGVDGAGNNTFGSNNFIIDRCRIQASGSIALNNTTSLIVTGLGMSFGNFTNNTFKVTDTAIDTFASVGGTNTTLLGVGIGTSQGIFTGNNFTISNSLINTSVSTGTNINVSDALGVGATASGNFGNNTFTMTGSKIVAQASIIGANTGSNESGGIGLNTQTGSAGVFTGNQFTISDVSIDASSLVGTNSSSGRNITSGIGTLSTVGTFSNNVFNIDGITMGVLASTQNNNSGINGSFGIDSAAAASTNNLFNINSSLFAVKATTELSNTGINSATGLFAAAGSTINISNSMLDILAIVGSNSSGTNQANATGGSGMINTSNTQFRLIKIP